MKIKINYQLSVRPILFGVDEVPVAGREVDGPEVGGSLFEFEGGGETPFAGFACAQHAAGRFDAGTSVNQPDSVATRQLQVQFQQAAVGIHHEGECIGGSKFAVLEACFEQQADVQQDALTAAARRGIESWIQVLYPPPSLSVTLPIASRL